MVNVLDLLPFVEKPVRYLGSEWNSVHKDAKELLRFALVYPDLYEIGMSHVGSRILYELINERDDAVCERAFAPGLDMERLLREREIPLFSLESRTPLGEFHIIGITLQYELTYTNILNIIDLADVPMFSKDRLPDHPLIIGGGASVFNPEPLAPFFDCFVIGEGEEVLSELILSVNKWRKTGSTNREELLFCLAQIPGIYVPSFYDVSYNEDGTIQKIIPNKLGVPDTVVKRVVKNLDDFPYPKRPIVPYTEVVHNRMTLELFRGCTRGCRFCQAGMIYRPVRERSPKTLREILKSQSQETGYEDVTLSSLSSADYTGLEEFVESITDFCQQNSISVSLPSTRIDNFPINLAKKLHGLRRSSITLAPEAGSQRLRKFINKTVSSDDLIESMNNAFSFGWRTVKLYFMIGIPSEGNEDLLEMCDMVREALHVGRRYPGGKSIELNIGISSFVPKAHTPFQWEPQDPVELLEEKHNFLKFNLPKRNIKLSWHNPLQSHVEAVLSRGDRRVAMAILRAWELGARLDEWSDIFQFLKWEAAFRDTDIEPAFYANRKRSTDEVFPWDHISTGVSKAWLKKEYKNAYNLEERVDCHWEPCYNCGVCSPLKVKVKKAKPDNITLNTNVTLKTTVGDLSNNGDITRYVAVFNKGEDVKYISHLDLMRTIERGMRRASIPTAMTKGFHKRSKISLASPLALGITSSVELLEFELLEKLDPEEILRMINTVLPEGLAWVYVKNIFSKAPSLMSQVESADYSVKAVVTFNSLLDFNCNLLNEHILYILNKKELLLPVRNGKQNGSIDGVRRPVYELGLPAGLTLNDAGIKNVASFRNVRPFIHDIKWMIEDNGIVHFTMRLATGSKGGIKPQDFLSLLNNESWNFLCKTASRTAINLTDLSHIRKLAINQETIQLKEFALSYGERDSCQHRRAGGQGCNP